MSLQIQNDSLKQSGVPQGTVLGPKIVSEYDQEIP